MFAFKGKDHRCEGFLPSYRTLSATFVSKLRKPPAKAGGFLMPNYKFR
jgi:hypothetical protein